MIMEIVAIIVSTIIFEVMFFGDRWGGALAYIVDCPTLICMLVIILPILLKKGLAKDFRRAFKLLNKKYECSFSELRHALDIVEIMQKQILCAGCIITFQGLFITLHRLSDIASLGPNLNVSLLAVLYTAILELLMLPLQIEVKGRIVDYMDKGQDIEESDEAQETVEMESEKDIEEPDKVQEAAEAEREQDAEKV